MSRRRVVLIALLLLGGIAVYAVELVVLREMTEARISGDAAGVVWQDPSSDAGRGGRRAGRFAADGPEMGGTAEEGVANSPDPHSAHPQPGAGSGNVIGLPGRPSAAASDSTGSATGSRKPRDRRGPVDSSRGYRSAPIIPPPPEPGPRPEPTGWLRLLPRNLKVPEVGQDAVIVISGSGLGECTHLSVTLDFDPKVLAPAMVIDHVHMGGRHGGWTFEWHEEPWHDEPVRGGVRMAWSQGMSLSQGLGADTLCVVRFRTVGRGFGRLHFEEIVALGRHRRPLACKHANCVVEVARF